ncbi:hypothetical protein METBISCDRAFT_19661 [Metschnikowia bicuspidata]|uniref:LSM12 anticodon-binding domain-containing protein n=1 Tax=Metschnikowia bicuspidata TaxID=27322 RepID=A0A4P9Z9P9_9ASCO|nr:hypothetical protein METBISCDRAFT_19661 [Metschnikowia bicuspidata]
MNSLDQAINQKVEVITLLDETIVGTIYAFSPRQHVLALRMPSDDKDLFRIINSSFIKSIALAGPIAKGTRPESASGHGSSSTSPPTSLPTAASSRRNSHASVAPKKSDPSPLALKVFDKLVDKFGRENVLLQNNDSVLLFKEVIITKPYAVNRISNSKKTQSSKHLDKVKTALREIWLLGNDSKQGG